MKLVLFDIDGTMINTGGAALRAVNSVFLTLYGVPDAIDGIRAAGRTDPAILMDIFRKHLGRDYEPPEAARVFGLYIEQLTAQIDAAGGYLVLPGIPELLRELAARSGLALGIATGNIERGARVKMGPSGLMGFFGFGGYGSDSEDRDVVVAMAIERGRALMPAGETLEEVFVIGDTHLDILSARASGARTVAVATGIETAAELEAHGPDHLFEDFSLTDSVLEIF